MAPQGALGGRRPQIGRRITSAREGHEAAARPPSRLEAALAAYAARRPHPGCLTAILQHSTLSPLSRHVRDVGARLGAEAQDVPVWVFDVELVSPGEVLQRQADLHVRAAQLLE